MYLVWNLGKDKWCRCTQYWWHYMPTRCWYKKRKRVQATKIVDTRHRGSLKNFKYKQPPFHPHMRDSSGDSHSPYVYGMVEAVCNDMPE